MKRIIHIRKVREGYVLAGLNGRILSKPFETRKEAEAKLKLIRKQMKIIANRM